MNKKLSWTKTPPKVEGFYWKYSDGLATIVHVNTSQANEKVDKHTEWYGPLFPPAAP